MNDDFENETGKESPSSLMNNATFLLKITLGVLLFDIATYVWAAIHELYDFGVILETITFIFVLLSLDSINKNQIEEARPKLLLSILPIGWLIIYDLIELLTDFSAFFSFALDITLVVIIVLLFKAYANISELTKK